MIGFKIRGYFLSLYPSYILDEVSVKFSPSHLLSSPIYHVSHTTSLSLITFIHLVCFMMNNSTSQLICASEVVPLIEPPLKLRFYHFIIVIRVMIS